MSIKVMSWVWDNADASGSELLLLLAIADFGDDDGIAFPRVEKLCQKSRMSRASVFRALKSLREAKALEVTSRGRASQYRIIMTGLNLRPLESQSETGEGSQIETEVSDCDSRGLNVETSEVSLLRHRTVKDPSLNPVPTSTGGRDARRSAATDRGTRIPDDFHLTPEMIAWGKKNFPALDGEFHTAAFIDYWKSVPGAKGRKVDWVATWRTWIRRAAERQPAAAGANGHPAPRPSAATLRTQTGIDLIQQFAAEEGVDLPALMPPSRKEITP